MSVKIMVGGQMKVVADVISAGAIMKISSLFCVYSGSEWLECDGSYISRTAYADLYAAIGTTYGPGDGVNTFTIPTQAQAIRLPLSVTSDTTFSQFTSDADIVVNNPSAAYIDVSDGAAGPGIRICIIEQSAEGVTVYMDAGHTLSFTLQKGVLTLVWNGSAWQYVAGTSLRWVLTSGTSQTWKPPWTGAFMVTAQGPGGNGGTGNGYVDGESNAHAGFGGSGGGGGHASRRYALQAGTSCTYTVGTAAGTATSWTDRSAAITASSGANGANSPSGGSGNGGAGGSASSGDINMPGQGGSYGAGEGGDSVMGVGGQRTTSTQTNAAGGAYGGGGSGGYGASSSQAGAAGATGVVIIEVAA